MSLTRQQLAVIHVAAKNLGLDRDTYEDVLFSATGVRSSKDLDDRGFEAVLERFAELGWTNPNPKPFRRRNPRLQHAAPLGNTVSGAQQGLMQHLYSQLGMDSLPRQKGFNARVCGRAWPQTRAQAGKVIEALKDMLERGYVAGPDRA